MKAVDLHEGIREYLPFQPKDSWRVPQSPGCYLLTNAYHEVVYIGQTNDLRRRMSEHLDDIRITGLTPIGRATWFYYQILTGVDLKDAEDRLFMKYSTAVGGRPTLNRIGP